MQEGAKLVVVLLELKLSMSLAQSHLIGFLFLSCVDLNEPEPRVH